MQLSLKVVDFRAILKDLNGHRATYQYSIDLQTLQISAEGDIDLGVAELNEKENDSLSNNNIAISRNDGYNEEIHGKF